MTSPDSPKPSQLTRLALAAAAVAGVALLFIAAARGPAPAVAPAAAATGELQPTDRHRRVSRLVAEVIDRQHFRQAALDDELSSQVLDRYLEALDGNRSYFLASDIAEFDAYRTQLDDAIKSGQVDPAFAMFARYQQRNREMLTLALKLLEQQPDFTLDERYVYDREQSPWPKDKAELEELWRQRVKNDALSLMLAGKTWDEARDTLKKRYERFVKRVDQVTQDDVFELFMNAYSHVFDPHSNYLSPRNSEEYNIAMSLSYEGIGASLQLVDDYVTVMNILPGGAAAQSGTLKASDRITAVGQGKVGPLTDVVGWRLDDVVQLIRGPLNSVVRLQVLPAGASPGSQETVLEFTRNKVTLEAQAAKKELKTIQRGDRELKIGVISVPSFYQDYQGRVSGDRDYRSTTRDVRRLIEELKAENIDAMVVDLRDNGGGHLSEATGLVGLFIDKGPVVQLKETGGRIDVLDDPEPGVAWKGPLTVLVNRASASASEIFAGAIQDYGRGLVVGQQTYGKGTVQNLYPLDRYALGPNAGFGQLTVTIGKYYRVTGDSTQHRGVSPDITLPSLLSVDDIGESTRDSALPWDRIRGVDFAAGTLPASELPLVASRHAARAANDPDFRALQADVTAVAELRAQKSVSLNLEQRKREREQLDASRLSRENERRAAQGLPALKSLEELEAAEDTPDAVLAETVQIAADQLFLESTTPAQLTQHAPTGRGGNP